MLPLRNSACMKNFSERNISQSEIKCFKNSMTGKQNGSDE